MIEILYSSVSPQLVISLQPVCYNKNTLIVIYLLKIYDNGSLKVVWFIIVIYKNHLYKLK